MIEILCLAALALPQETPVAPPVEPAAAPAESPGQPGPPDGSGLTVGGGYLYQFKASLEGGGSVSANRGFAFVRKSWQVDAQLALNLEVGWEGGWYRFGSGTNLSLGTGEQPWGSVQSGQIAFGGRYALDEHLIALLSGFAQFSGEPDADADRSATGGGIAGLSWRASEKFTIGGGALVTSRLEDSVLAIPLLFIDWEITDGLRLTNVAGPDAYPTSAGLELVWEIHRDFDLAAGGNYVYRRFRLDSDNPVAPNGVGEDGTANFWIRARLGAAEGLRLDLVTGMVYDERLKIFDSNGNELAGDDADPGLMLGAFLSWKF
jgi:hypothetical protein